MATIEFFANLHGARFTRGTEAFGSSGLVTDAGRTYWFSVSDLDYSTVTLRHYHDANGTTGAKLPASHKLALRAFIGGSFLAILPASGHVDTGADHNAHVIAADAYCAANCPAGYVNRAPGIANLSPLPASPADPFAGWTEIDTSSDDLAHLPAEHGGPAYVLPAFNRLAERMRADGARRIAARLGLLGGAACNVIVRDLAPTILRGPRRAYA